jgi:hypothetical protein
MLPIKAEKNNQKGWHRKKSKATKPWIKKQDDTKLGTSFSRLYTRTTKGPSISRDGTSIQGDEMFSAHRRLPESTSENA